MKKKILVKKFKNSGKLVLVKNKNKIGMILYEISANSENYSVSQHTKNLVNLRESMYYVVCVGPIKIFGPLWKHEITFI